MNERTIAAPLSDDERQLTEQRHAAMRGERFPCRCEYDGPQWQSMSGQPAMRCAHCGGLRVYGCAMPPAALRLTAEQRRAEYTEWMRLRRAQRPVGIRAERPDTTPHETAALSARKRVALAEQDTARKRDEWTRRLAGVSYGPAEILRRCMAAAAKVNATDDERRDAVGALVLEVGRVHGGWSVPAAALGQGMLERRAYDRITAAQATAERRHTTSLDRLTERAEQNEQHGRSSLWMGALNARLAARLRRDALAAEIGGAEMWVRLSVVAGERLSSDERAALMAALLGKGSGPALAERLSMTPGALRVKLTRGRSALAERYPTADALADAMADAQLLGAADDARVRLSAEQRRAERATEHAQHRTAQLARTASRRGRSTGHSYGPQPETLRPAVTHSALVAWLAVSGRIPAAAIVTARRVTSDELQRALWLRRSWRTRRAWRLRIRAASMALAAEQDGGC